jgi:hypothetical protein
LTLAVAVVGGLVATTVGAAAQNAYCDGYARDYADRNTHAGGRVVGGAVTGAVGGAIIGGIIGGGRGAGTGAAIGAGVGAVGGAASSGPDWRANYNYAYNNCIRGGQPARAYGPRYEPWSPGWYQACSRAYPNSFNRTGDGTYVDRYGNRQFCNL